MDGQLIIGEKQYISSSRAAEMTKYSNDYIGQLCRSGKINGRMVGRSWFVDQESLLAHKKENDPRHQNKNISFEKAPERAPEHIAAPSNVSVKTASSSTIKYEKDDRPLLPKLIKKFPPAGRSSEEPSSRGGISWKDALTDIVGNGRNILSGSKARSLVVILLCALAGYSVIFAMRGYQPSVVAYRQTSEAVPSSFSPSESASVLDAVGSWFSGAIDAVRTDILSFLGIGSSGPAAISGPAAETPNLVAQAPQPAEPSVFAFRSPTVAPQINAATATANTTVIEKIVEVPAQTEAVSGSGANGSDMYGSLAARVSALENNLSSFQALQTLQNYALGNDIGRSIPVVSSGAGSSGNPGSVTSIDASGGATGLSVSGGPVTSSGTLTLGGVLDTESGGTGTSTYSAGDILYGNQSGSLSDLPASVNGLVLKLVNGLPSWSADLIGSGGAGAWATSTNDLFIYPADTSNVVVIGDNATTTTNSILEVTGNANFTGTASTTDLVASDSAVVKSLSVGSLSGLLFGASGAVSAVSTSSLNINTNDLVEGNTNRFFTTPRVQSYLDSISKGYFFATTSADYWGSTKGYLTGNQPITLSGDVSGTGATNITTTIGNGKITSAMLSNAVAIPLASTTGTLPLASTTGILAISNGGTGLSMAPSYGQLLVGSGSGNYSLVSTSSLGISGGGPSYLANSGSNTYLSAGSNLESPYFTATSTTATSTFPILRAGEIADHHADGSWTYTVATTSSDLGRGTALLTAVSKAQNGDSLYLASTTYDLGSSTIDLSIGGTGSISMHGAGEYQTIIKSSQGAQTGLTPIIVPATHSETTDLSIIGTNNYVYQAAWGSYDAGYAITDAILRNVNITSGTDGVYFSDDSGNDLSPILDNVSVSSQWDGVSFLATAGTMNIYDSSIISTGNSPEGGGVARGLDAYDGGTATINLYNTDITVTGGSSMNAGVILSSGLTNITVNMDGGSITTSGPGAVDLSNTGFNVINVTSNTVYNPSKTSGTITYADNPQLLYSLGSSGASSTVLWNQNGVASWVATSSLNIAPNLNGAYGTLGVGNGGTGVSSFTTGDLLYGNGGSIATSSNLTFDGTTLFANTLSATTMCLTGSTCITSWPIGGGSVAGGTWSTTTSSVPGELINYSNKNEYVVTIGNTSTTTAKYWFDPNAQTAYLSGNVGIGSTLSANALSLANALTVANGGTGTTTFGQGWIYSSGGTGALSASTSPTVAYIMATSTAATSTFMGSISIGTTTTGIQGSPSFAFQGAPWYEAALTSVNTFAVYGGNGAGSGLHGGPGGGVLFSTGNGSTKGIGTTNGGDFNVITGNGGGSSTGNGGNASFILGNSGSGAIGGTFSVAAGAGSASNGSPAGGNGGNISLTAGNGGNGVLTSANNGAGGTLTFTTGSSGTGAPGAANGGNVIFALGAGTGGGSNGMVGIGTASPSATLSVAGSGLFYGGLTASNIVATNTLTVSGTTNLNGNVSIGNNSPYTFIMSAFQNGTGGGYGNQDLYILGSNDAVNWTSITGTTPISLDNGNIRDAHVIQWNGIYYLSYTSNASPANYFGMATSSNLTTWSSPIYVNTGISLADTWSPRPFIDQSNQLHIFFTGGDDSLNTMQEYELHPFSPSLSSWSTAVAVTGSALPSNMLDPDMNYINGIYYLFYKDETTKYIELATSSSLTSGFNWSTAGDWAGWGGSHEGPDLIAIPNSNDYRIYFSGLGTGEYSSDSTNFLNGAGGTWSYTHNSNNVIFAGGLDIQNIGVMVPLVPSNLSVSGNLAATGTLAVFGTTTLAALNAGTTTLSSLSIGSLSGLLLGINGSISAVSTSSLNLSIPLASTTGTLGVSNGGTGQTSFGQGWLNSDGAIITSSTSPTVAYITATSTAATSTFAGNLNIGYGLSLDNQLFAFATGTRNFYIGGAMPITALSVTGTNNLFEGFSAGSSNTTGSYNVANGYQTLASNTTGSGNVANGDNALYLNTTGSGNVANGNSALTDNTTGSYNVANGNGALTSNTTGSYNVAAGNSALFLNTAGSYNIATGYGALTNNTAGSYNIATGYGALYLSATGSSNTAIGYNAGNNLTSGSSNIVIGNDVNLPSATGNQQLNIGNLIYGIGVSSTTVPSSVPSGGFVGIATTSPFAALSVAGDGYFSGNLTASNVTATGTLTVSGTGTSTFAGPITSPSVSSPSGNLTVSSAGTTNYLLLNPNGGNVGIGTSNPGYALEVNGAAGIDSGLTLGGNLSMNYGQSITLDSSTYNDMSILDDPASIYGHGSNTLVFNPGSHNNDTVVFAGTAGPDNDHSIYFDNTGMGIGVSYAGGGHKSALDVAGNMSLGAYAGTNAAPANGLIVSGSVGIGTSSPAATLGVNGNIYVGGSGTSTIQNNLNVEGTLHGKTVYSGDLFFANDFSFTEAPLDGAPQGLLLKNQNGSQILSIDDAGNLTVPGDICAGSATSTLGGSCLGQSLQTFNSRLNALASSTADLGTGNTAYAGLASTTIDISTQVAAIDLKIDALASSTVTFADLASSTASIASTTAAKLASSTPFIQTIANAVVALLQSSGQLISSAATWTVGEIHATLAVFTDVKTGSIETDTAAVTNGLEMTDSATGRIYCVRITNGDLGKTTGPCAVEATVTPATATTTQSITAVTAVVPVAPISVPQAYPSLNASDTPSTIVVSTTTITDTVIATTTVSTATISPPPTAPGSTTASQASSTAAGPITTTVTAVSTTTSPVVSVPAPTVSAPATALSDTNNAPQAPMVAVPAGISTSLDASSTGGIPSAVAP